MTTFFTFTIVHNFKNYNILLFSISKNLHVLHSFHLHKQAKLDPCFRKKGESICLTFLQLVFPRSAMYISLVLGVVNTFCSEGTIILLIDRLTNIYPIVIVVVVMVMVCPCESLLWYRKYDCRQC